jgi:hypothetical protein
VNFERFLKMIDEWEKCPDREMIAHSCCDMFEAIRKSLDEGLVEDAYGYAAGAELAINMFLSPSNRIKVTPLSSWSDARGGDGLRCKFVGRTTLPNGNLELSFAIDCEENKTMKLAKAGRGRSKGGQNNNGGPEARAQRDAQLVAEFARQRNQGSGKMEAYRTTARRCRVSRTMVERAVRNTRG